MDIDVVTNRVLVVFIVYTSCMYTVLLCANFSFILNGIISHFLYVCTKFQVFIFNIDSLKFNKVCE